MKQQTEQPSMIYQPLRRPERLPRPLRKRLIELFRRVKRGVKIRKDTLEELDILRARSGFE